MINNSHGALLTDVSFTKPSLQTIKIENLLGSIVDMVCAIDINGVFHYVSPSSLHLLGYMPDEMLGKSFLNFIVPNDIDKTLKVINDRTPGCFTSNFENRYKKKDETVLPIIWSARWNETDNLMYCVARDGSEKKFIEDRLLKAQQIAKLTHLEFDAATHCFTYISEHFYTISGMEKSKIPLPLAAYITIVHPDDQKKLESVFYSADTQEKGFEYRIVKPNGETIYIAQHSEIFTDSTGNPVKTICVLQDITERKSYELKLLQSERKFKTLVQNGSDLIGVIDVHGTYKFISESTLYLLGYEVDFLIGKNAFDFIHPDDRARTTEMLSQINVQNHIVLKPFRFKNASGEWRWVETTISNFLNDPEIAGLICNSRDITEKKISDDKIKQLSLIAEETNNAVILTNLNHSITWVNKAFTLMSGFSLEDVVDKSISDIFFKSQNQVVQPWDFEKDLQAGKSVSKEIASLTKSGKAYWMELQIQSVFDEAHHLVQYLAIGKDISERIKNAWELTISEQKFKSLVQHGSDVICIIDETGAFNYISENAVKIFGYTPEYLKGKIVFDFLHPEELISAQSKFYDIIHKNNNAKGLRHRFLKDDGEWLWLESKGTIYDIDANTKGILINARDINDRVKLQEKLDGELLNRQKQITAAVIRAQESERSQLGLELHDNVNQVLTTVKLYNEMYLTDTFKDQQLLIKANNYIQQCISEIRSISKRLSAPTLGNISFEDSINELVASINITNRLEVTYHSENMEGLAISRDLHLAIYRIIQEALNNILKYAEATTVIILIEQVDGNLCLYIEDDGKGFNSTTSNKGIGITNMKTRANNLNGTFKIKSMPGEGCKIEVSFPVAEFLKPQ